jgi:hypothetical protein
MFHFKLIFESIKKLGSASSFNMTFFMKDDVKVKVPNTTPKILIPLDGVVNWDGVLKLSGRPEGDHVAHFLCYKKKPIT